MTGVRKGEEHVSIPLRRDRSWACGHVLMWTCGHVDMEERFDRSTVHSYGYGALHEHMRRRQARWPHMSTWAHVGHLLREERFDLVAAQHG
jgi:hypothetical protein